MHGGLGSYSSLQAFTGPSQVLGAMQGRPLPCTGLERPSRVLGIDSGSSGNPHPCFPESGARILRERVSSLWKKYAVYPLGYTAYFQFSLYDLVSPWRC